MSGYLIVDLVTGNVLARNSRIFALTGLSLESNSLMAVFTDENALFTTSVEPALTVFWLKAFILLLALQKHYLDGFRRQL